MSKDFLDELTNLKKNEIDRFSSEGGVVRYET